ncbi:MAG TPA: PHP domain-containing protein [Gemmataceae bacterium]|nr:PHP domain-containing protein [Gemmataceae bacterium]
MPRSSPFTQLWSRLAVLNGPRRADLHVHTTASDGEYTPSQVVLLARQAELAAVAITDHDTLASVEEARAFAQSLPKQDIEVVPGVEISTAFDGRELHLLGYFVRTDDSPLLTALAKVCEARRERFRDYLAKLADDGRAIPADRAKLVEVSTASLGRRHVAGLLVSCGIARTRDEAFGRFIHRLHGRVLPKQLLPIEEAIALVRAAGGVTSLAHPPAEMGDAEFRRLRDFGLDALESEYAWKRSSPAVRLREAAAQLGMLVTGGSDCHGPDPAHRRIGSDSITSEQFEKLRERAARRD